MPNQGRGSNERGARTDRGPERWISVPKVVTRYGGTTDEWVALIRSGLIPGRLSRGRGVYLIRAGDLLAYVRKSVARAVAWDSMPPGTPVRVIDSGSCRILPNGEALLGSTSIPVWRLEQARRAGSDEAALLSAFPESTSQDLEFALVYARRHADEIDRMIRERGATAPRTDDEGDAFADEGEFLRDLDSLLEADDELFRRLTDEVSDGPEYPPDPRLPGHTVRRSPSPAQPSMARTSTRPWQLRRRR